MDGWNNSKVLVKGIVAHFQGDLVFASGGFGYCESYIKAALIDLALTEKLVGFPPIKVVITIAIAAYSRYGNFCADDSL